MLIPTRRIWRLFVCSYCKSFVFIPVQINRIHITKKQSITNLTRFNIKINIKMVLRIIVNNFAQNQSEIWSDHGPRNPIGPKGPGATDIYGASGTNGARRTRTNRNNRTRGAKGTNIANNGRNQLFVVSSRTLARCEDLAKSKLRCVHVPDTLWMVSLYTSTENIC